MCKQFPLCYFHPKQPQKGSPIALIYSLHIRKYKFREAQTLAKVTQQVRSKAEIQGSVTPKPGWILSCFVGKGILRLEGTLGKSGPVHTLQTEGPRWKEVPWAMMKQFTSGVLHLISASSSASYLGKVT